MPSVAGDSHDPAPGPLRGARTRGRTGPTVPRASPADLEPRCVAWLEVGFWSCGSLTGVIVTLVGGPDWMAACFVGTLGSTMVSRRLAWVVCRWLGWVRPTGGPTVF